MRYRFSKQLFWEGIGGTAILLLMGLMLAAGLMVGINNSMYGPIF